MTVEYNPPSSCILDISVKGIKLSVQEDYYACDRVWLFCLLCVVCSTPDEWRSMTISFRFLPQLEARFISSHVSLCWPLRSTAVVVASPALKWHLHLCYLIQMHAFVTLPGQQILDERILCFKKNLHLLNQLVNQITSPFLFLVLRVMSAITSSS